jgi:hypothetical protein
MSSGTLAFEEGKIYDFQSRSGSGYNVHSLIAKNHGMSNHHIDGEFFIKGSYMDSIIPKELFEL